MSALDTLKSSGMDAPSHWSVIAQLVEQATVNRPVVGSSPTHGAIVFPRDAHTYNDSIA